MYIKDPNSYLINKLQDNKRYRLVLYVQFSLGAQIHSPNFNFYIGEVYEPNIPDRYMLLEQLQRPGFLTYIQPTWTKNRDFC